MGRQYTITNVQRRDQWNSPRFGDFQDYAITVADDDQGWIKLTQKLDTRPPEKGDTIFGTITIEKTKYDVEYRKFKKENPQFQDRSPQGGGVPAQELQGLKDDVSYAIEMLEELTLRREAPENPKPRGNATGSQADEYEDPFAGLGI